MFRRRHRLTAEQKAANLAAREAHKAKANASHCQICARGILSNTGLVAHHGYQRPGDGWQTASCMGARYRPYEVACDALPPAIESVKAHIARTEKALAHWQAEPPQGIRCDREKTNRTNAWDKYRVEWSVIRPANFDPTAPVGFENQAPWDSMPDARSSYGYRPCDLRTYAAVYDGKIKGLAHDIEASKQTLAYFEKRLAEWVAPVTTPETCTA